MYACRMHSKFKWVVERASFTTVIVTSTLNTYSVGLTINQPGGRNAGAGRSLKGAYVTPNWGMVYVFLFWRVIVEAL